MKLTDVVLRLSNHIKFNHIPGNILNGKHRIWPKLSPKYKQHLLRRIDTEINNMKYISRPYISDEESKPIFEQLQKEKSMKEHMDKLAKTRANKNKMEDRLVSDHLDSLRYHNVWE